MTDPSPFNAHDTDAAVKRPRQHPVGRSGQAIAINMASILVLSLAGLAIVAAATSLMHGLRTDEAKQAWGLQRLALVEFWFQGVCYGGVSGLAWMAMMLRRRGWMYFAQALIAVIGAWCVHQFSDHSIVRILANTLGLVVLQTAGFHFFPPIGWRSSSRETTNLSQSKEDSATRQFSIFDVIACTIAMAALFALMRQVQLGDAARFYWVVLLWIWVCDADDRLLRLLNGVASIRDRSADFLALTWCGGIDRDFGFSFSGRIRHEHENC